jgi:cytochrome c peroxidase
MGLLRARDFTLPAMFPGALAPLAASGPARLRYNGSDAANFDSIQCVLRAVGTYPTVLDANQRGVAPSDVRVREVRANMSTVAQGADGYNVPALVGMAAGAPYFHAGNARTLEEAFGAVFQTHYQAFSANFLTTGDRATQVRQLVAFINSIDDDAAPVTAVMGTLGFNPDLCPTSFP